MKSITSLMARFGSDESGEDLIEYGLLAAFVAAVATAVIISDVGGIRAALVGAFTKVKAAINQR